jgi:hypothetical protein
VAKYRLLTAHQLRHEGLKSDVWLPGDKENEHLGDERGTVVGDGTDYPVVSPTVQMVALDTSGEAMLDGERSRLARNETSMNPIDNLPTTLAQLLGGGRDDYDDRYIPGFPGTPRPPRPSPKLVE